jgi:hypothetical protein
MPRSSSMLLRFLGRYAIAAIMIPVGVALGIGGLVQFGLRRALNRVSRTGSGGARGRP